MSAPAVIALFVAATTPAAGTTGPSAPSAIWSVPMAHTGGVLVGMRLALSIAWPSSYNPFPLSRSGERFARAYTVPPELRGDRALLESDGDPWAINLIGHSLFGAELHGRVRRCGGGFLQALAFTAGASVLWEYGIESFHKRPSAVDLVLTPVMGAALGEGRYQLQRYLARRPLTVGRRVLEFLIDPLGETERGLLQTRC